jgi:hypothetical protein
MPSKRTGIGKTVPDEFKLVNGRPRKQAPPDAEGIIREATAKGASIQGVAMALACDRDVLKRWLDESPVLMKAFSEGREKERQTLHSVLYDCAVAGQGKDSLIAAMFLLKSRHGYVEGQQENQANRVSINFTIPGAQPLENYRIIENDNRAESIPAKPIGRA